MPRVAHVLQCDGFFNYDRSAKFDSNSTAAIYDANVALIASSSKPRAK